MKYENSLTLISDEISQDLAVVARFLREFGLRGFELRSMAGRAFKDLTDQDVAAVGAAAAAEGWRIHGCASPVFKCELDDQAAVRQSLEQFKRALEVARALDCNLVRVFTFLRRPARLDEATLQRIAGHLQTLHSLAAGSGVRIGVENESSCIIGTGEETLRLFAALPSPQFGVIWDPCNSLCVLGARTPVTAPFAQLLPRLFHIHLKDAIRRVPPDPGRVAEVVPFGVGEVGWHEHLREIERSAYRGLLSLETHWRLKPIDEKLMHLPAGYAFSQGGEEASRVSLRNLLGILAAIS
jgi:sugar phosphate isomerase/epimerase